MPTGTNPDMSSKRSRFPFLSHLSGIVTGILPKRKKSLEKSAVGPSFSPISGKTGSRHKTGLSKTIDLDGTTVSYLLCRSHRRTIGFVIDESGLRVTAPKRSTIYTIEKALVEKRKWILDKLDYYRNRQRAKPTPTDWREGTVFPYLGKELTLHLEESPTRRTAVLLAENHLVIHLSPDALPVVPDHLQKWLKTQARNIFAERLQLYAEKMNVKFDSFGLSGARTRWGSCSVRRHIRLNWRLVHCDISLIDYVVIHELAHLFEMNHSPRFWTIVKKWYPDPEKARKTLHELSPRLFSLFAKTG